MVEGIFGTLIVVDMLLGLEFFIYDIKFVDKDRICYFKQEITIKKN